MKAIGLAKAIGVASFIFTRATLAQTPQGFDPDKYLRDRQSSNPAAEPSSPTISAPDSWPGKRLDKTPPEIFRAASLSVVLLSIKDARGQPLSLGSGFFVAQNTIATNFHVIDGAAGGYAKVIGQPAKLSIEGVVGLDAMHDLALLQVAQSSAPALPVALETSAVNIGDAIFAIGNPQGLEGTFSPGIVSSVRELGPDRLLQITAPISPGSSGGPVLDHTGTVIGVSVASITNGQNLNFAIPADYLAALKNNKTELRPFNKLPQVKAHKTVLDRLGGQPPITGVVGVNFTYGDEVYSYSLEAGQSIKQKGFSYSLQNQLRQPVKDVVGVIAFYSRDGKPLDIVPIEYTGVIPAGLAKRISGAVDSSVWELNQWEWGSAPDKKGNDHSFIIPAGKIEFRILDFALAND